MAKKKINAGDKTISEKDRLDALEKWYQSIHAASNDATKADEKLSEAKAKVKLCEKNLERTKNLLRQLTRDSPFQTRLFDIADAEGAAAEAKKEAAGESEQTAETPAKKGRAGKVKHADDPGAGKAKRQGLKIAKEDDDQREVNKKLPSAVRAKLPVSDMGIAPALVKRLEEAGIKTMGDLAAYVEHTPISVIKGIGDGKAKVIADAWIDWQNAAK